jgi:hypothetical protein
VHRKTDAQDAVVERIPAILLLGDGRADGLQHGHVKVADEQQEECDANRALDGEGEAVAQIEPTRTEI